MIRTEQALVPTAAQTGKTHTYKVAKFSPATTGSGARRNPQPNPLPAPLSGELVDAILKGRGLRGWIRAANITRVLGLLSLYLFLDTYDVRANFSSRTADRKREEARARGRLARFQEWSRGLDRLLVDKLIRALRFFVFRGADGSLKKEARLAKQAAWLRQESDCAGPNVHQDRTSARHARRSFAAGLCQEN